VTVSCVLGSEEEGRSGVIVVIRQLCYKTDRVRTCVIEGGS
jgi:hypothetical protein